MGNWFLLGLIVAFVIYELVMHYVFHNELGNETLSHITVRLEKRHRWIIGLTGALITVLFLHITLRQF